MKTISEFVRLIKGSRGVATSLIEATATVAVGAVLAGVAVGGAIDAINDSKIQAAIGDVGSIGQGVITFYKDNSFFPLFKDGDKTGAGDDFFKQLASENGTYPTTHSSLDLHWGVPVTPPAWETTSLFGHKVDYVNHDSIEGHLIRNELGGLDTKRYPLRGSYAGDPQRGWAGPYIAVLPKTDPWGNKYLINVQELHSGHLLNPTSGHVGASVGNLPKIAVIVLSAGANRTIETSSQQTYDNFITGGDDIVFRIK
jgi:hypothetical protein